MNKPYARKDKRGQAHGISTDKRGYKCGEKYVSADISADISTDKHGHYKHGCKHSKRGCRRRSMNHHQQRQRLVAHLLDGLHSGLEGHGLLQRGEATTAHISGHFGGYCDQRVVGSRKSIVLSSCSCTSTAPPAKLIVFCARATNSATRGRGRVWVLSACARCGSVGWRVPERRC